MQPKHQYVMVRNFTKLHWHVIGLNASYKPVISVPNQIKLLKYISFPWTYPPLDECSSDGLVCDILSEGIQLTFHGMSWLELK